MPAYTYPGVYIEEVPSGVHPIQGVATSITAFVGATERGPVNEPVLVDGYGAFVRRFGAVRKDDTLAVAVQDFFRNGGGQALIVRLYRSHGPDTARVSCGDRLTLTASSPGKWGNNLRARVGPAVPSAVANELGLDLLYVFDLTVRDMSTGVQETFANVTMTDDVRRVDRVLKAQSELVRAEEPRAGTQRPTPSAQPGPAESPWSEAHSFGVTSTDSTPVSTEEGLQPGDFTAGEATKTGLFALLKADLFNLLCIPPYDARDIDEDVRNDALELCASRRAILLLDPPVGWRVANGVNAAATALAANPGAATVNKNAAVFFPMIKRPNALRGGIVEQFVPCGAVAGVIARTDAERGVWKAPAGLDAVLMGVPELSVPMTDQENGQLNQLGVNCLRVMPSAGPVVWGARTRQGDDRLASEWKYLPVRRLTLFIEESLYRGTQWVVFEPNDEPLWSQIRLNVGAFLQDLFRRGAFAGRTAREAYFVRCDAQTTTARDRDLGIVNIVVGFAPVKPAEFVVIQIQQLSGQSHGQG